VLKIANLRIFVKCIFCDVFQKFSREQHKERASCYTGSNARNKNRASCYIGTNVQPNDGASCFTRTTHRQEDRASCYTDTNAIRQLPCIMSKRTIGKTNYTTSLLGLIPGPSKSCTFEISH
jgi:hypothetical protein